MIFRIDSISPIPPFEQLRAQIALTVSSGRLKAGDKLPTVRGLAAELGLSNGTVARAYRELEQAGVVVGKGRQGTFVAAELPDSWSSAEQTRQLASAANDYAALAHRLGVAEEEALAALTEAFARPSNANQVSAASADHI